MLSGWGGAEGGIEHVQPLKSEHNSLEVFLTLSLAQLES